GSAHGFTSPIRWPRFTLSLPARCRKLHERGSQRKGTKGTWGSSHVFLKKSAPRQAALGI
ncbi:MAG: hypothetical protein WD278_21425, partial [Pirellulales bacterium]